MSIFITINSETFHRSHVFAQQKSMAIKFSKLLLNIELVQFLNSGNKIDPDKRFVTKDVSGITGVHLSKWKEHQGFRQ